MNRYEQISRTLPENLRNNVRFVEDIEFVLVNFINGPEGLKTDRWVRGKFKDEIKSGYLRYFVTDKMPQFHASVAKNTTHINASGLYLFNLDGDNYITPEETSFLLDRCIYDSVAHLWSGIWFDGSYGKIGMGAWEFSVLYGYNEDFLPKGHQDMDLLKRFLCFLRKTMLIRSEQAVKAVDGRTELSACFKVAEGMPEPKEAIPNSYQERLASTELGGRVFTELEASGIQREWVEKNKKLAVVLTKNYSRVFRQEKIGVEVTAVTADSLGNFSGLWRSGDEGESQPPT